MAFHADETLLVGEPHDPQQAASLGDGYAPVALAQLAAELPAAPVAEPAA